MSSASIGPPDSWPCHPSTPRLSRLPQPTSHRIAPLEPFAPQGAGSLLLLGARLARGGAPAKEGRGRCPQDPLYCARDFSRRIPAANAIAQSPPLFRTPTVFPEEPRQALSRLRPCRPFARTVVAASRLRGIAPHSCGCAIPTVSSEAPIRALRRSQSPRPFNGTQQRSAPLQVCPHVGHCKSGVFLPNQPKAFDFFGPG